MRITTSRGTRLAGPAVVVGAVALAIGAPAFAPLLVPTVIAQATPATAQGPHEPRDLGTLPPELRALRWPAAPRIAHHATVRTAGELQRAVDTPGTEARVVAAIDGPITIHASDVAIVGGTPSAAIGHVTIDTGVQRVRIADLRASGFELAVPARWTPDPQYDESLFVTDVTFDGLHVVADDSAFVIRGRRVAVLDTDVTAERYSLWAGDTGPLDGQDVIVAGCTFRSAGPESTLRMHDVLRSVVVDSLLENPRKHCYRIHGRGDLAWASRVVMLHGGIMIGNQPGDRVGTVWIVDDELHHDLPSLLEIDFDHIAHLVMYGNVVYTNVWEAAYPYDHVAPGWTVHDNRRLPYRPYSP